MQGWSKLHLSTWMLLTITCVFSYKVTDSKLRLCDNDRRVCVTKYTDCSPPSQPPIEKTLNMSCYFYMLKDFVTCEWSEESKSHTESNEVSFIFKSIDPLPFIVSSHDGNAYCDGLFNPLANFSVTVRMRDDVTGHEITSQPYSMDYIKAVRPLQPTLTVLSSSADSVQVSWSRDDDLHSCRLRYRETHTPVWSQASESIPAHQDWTIEDLLPFTLYSAAVACKYEYGVWSDWSADITVRTQEKVPSKPPEVCYRLEKPDSASFLLLMWKDLDLHEARGRVLGYQVTYRTQRLQQDVLVQNVSVGTARLPVEEGNFNVTVRAFNMAGYGPVARLSVDTSRQITLPTIRNLWVSSSFPLSNSFLVQWRKPEAPPTIPPVTHFAVQWFPEDQPSSQRYTTVDSSSSSTVIQDVAANESYLIRVFPVHQHQCGAPQSLPASLQQGALMEVVGLRVVGKTQTTVSVEWAWQRKSGPIRVQSYTVMLRTDSDASPAVSLWPDMFQHTFSNLKPNTEYSLLLLADNFTRLTIPITDTDFDRVTAVATATPLLLLAAIVFIACVLSRAGWKSYFFPPISSPRCSTTGQWLMDPNQQKTGEIKVLDIEDFQVTDVLGEKSLILVDPDAPSLSDEDLSEDTCKKPLWPFTIAAQSGLKLDSDYIPDTAVVTDGRQTQETHDFTRKEEVGCSEKSYPKQTSIESNGGEFMANMDSMQYVMNSPVDHVGVQNVDCSYLICESAYIANSLPVRADPSVPYVRQTDVLVTECAE